MWGRGGGEGGGGGGGGGGEDTFIPDSGRKKEREIYIEGEREGE